MDYSELKRQLNNNTLKSRFLDDYLIGNYDSGEVWEIKTGNTDFSQILILEKIDDEILLVVPLCHWTEYAGPKDLFIPFETLGTEVIVMFELEFNINKKSLKKCNGKLYNRDLDYILSARDSLERGIKNNFKWGWEYFENYDIAYKYHDDFAKEIEILQEDLYDNIFQEHSGQFTQNNKYSVIQFLRPREACNELAAASKKYAIEIEYEVESIPNVKIKISEIDNCDSANVYIYDKSGDISLGLAGAKVFNAEDEEVALIEKNNAEFENSRIEDGFFIVDKNDHKLNLRKIKICKRKK